MHNPKAECSEQQRQLVTSYDLVAVGYDTQRYMRVCANPLVELVGLPSGAKVLDVATGTGWAALAAAQTVGATGQVVGVDMTPGMLEQAAAEGRDGPPAQYGVLRGRRAASGLPSAQLRCRPLRVCHFFPP